MVSDATTRRPENVAAESVRTVKLPDGELRLGLGLLAGVADVTSALAPANRVVVIADETVASLHLSTLTSGFPKTPLVLTVPSGEAEKSRQRWAELTDRMIEAGCGRDTTVVALGGGVIGDLAGFVAATYMRGVPVIQVPTTLLAMVDASVGGKTAVDVPGGKNLVGAFHPPAVVLADSSVLATLTARQARAGVAEMLKHGVLGSGEHFEAVRSAARPLATKPADAPCGDSIEPLGRLVSDSAAIKAGVVREDPLERGRRRVLNFGHTVAHALEAATGYQLLHGEAVAIGMVIEARIGESMGISRQGLADDLEHALKDVGLPFALPDSVGYEDLRPWMGLDKKNERGEPACALPRTIGEMEPADGRWSVRVPDAVIMKVLAR